jgi:hypothetical protein
VLSVSQVEWKPGEHISTLVPVVWESVGAQDRRPMGAVVVRPQMPSFGSTPALAEGGESWCARSGSHIDLGGGTQGTAVCHHWPLARGP